MKKYLVAAFTLVMFGFVLATLYAKNDKPKPQVFHPNQAAGPPAIDGLNHGFEPSTANSNAWASVVRGAIHDNQKNVKVVVDLNTTPQVQLTVKPPNEFGRLDLEPKDQNLTAAETVMTLIGRNPATEPLPQLRSIQTGYIEAKNMGNNTVLATLNVMILPELDEISVGFYRVWDPVSEANVGGVANAPADQDLINELNDIFKQAGVRFALAEDSGPVPISYDQGTANGRMSEQEMIDLFNNATILNKQGKLKVLLANNSDQPYPPPNQAHKKGGNTGPASKKTVVFCETLLARNPQQPVVTAVAHEIGHQLLLSARNAVDGHDPGSAPANASLLMKAGTPANNVFPTLGRWLPNQDWRQASEEAKVILALP